MKVSISGPLSVNLAQSLCQLYFPNEKFGVNASADPEVSFVLVEANGEISATVGISHKDNRACAKASFPISSLYTYKASARIAAGTAFLDAAKQIFGYHPPWGMLTGIRSSKVALDLFARCGSKEETLRRLTDDYLITPHKATLLIQTALYEKQVLQHHGEDTCALYISVPFCPTRCSYCSFVSYATPRLLSLLPQYMEKLNGDIVSIGQTIRNKGKRVSTVYIGGGTPSILSVKQIEELLSSVNLVAPDAEEVTFEAGRPDTITLEKMQVAQQGGVTRVCVNPQSTNDSTLASIGRSHSAEDFFRAMEIVKQAGIPSINVDIIAGLPNEAPEAFCKTVDDVLSADPHSVTVHTFCVKKSSYEADSNQDLQTEVQKVSESVDYSRSALESNGLLPYYMYRQKKTVGNLENVGFAIPGHQCAYNAIMMSDVRDIYAVGAGAVTKIMIGGVAKRDFMPKYPYEYLSF